MKHVWRPFAWRSDALAEPRLAEATMSPSRVSCRLACRSAQPVSLTLARNNRRGDASPTAVICMLTRAAMHIPNPGGE
jgi:hypothetical protein